MTNTSTCSMTAQSLPIGFAPNSKAPLEVAGGGALVPRAQMADSRFGLLRAGGVRIPNETGGTNDGAATQKDKPLISKSDAREIGRIVAEADQGASSEKLVWWLSERFSDVGDAFVEGLHEAQGESLDDPWDWEEDDK